MLKREGGKEQGAAANAWWDHDTGWKSQRGGSLGNGGKDKEWLYRHVASWDETREIISDNFSWLVTSLVVPYVMAPTNFAFFPTFNKDQTSLLSPRCTAVLILKKKNFLLRLCTFVIVCGKTGLLHLFWVWIHMREQLMLYPCSYHLSFNFSNLLSRSCVCSWIYATFFVSDCFSSSLYLLPC